MVWFPSQKIPAVDDALMVELTELKHSSALSPPNKKFQLLETPLGTHVFIIPCKGQNSPLAIVREYQIFARNNFILLTNSDIFLVLSSVRYPLLLHSLNYID